MCGAGVLIWPFVLIVGHVPISADTYRYGLIPIAPLLLLAANAAREDPCGARAPGRGARVGRLHHLGRHVEVRDGAEL